MPVMKKAVFDAVKATLEGEQRKLRFEVYQTKHEMARLVQKQTLSKRQLAALGELIRSMSPAPEEKP